MRNEENGMEMCWDCQTDCDEKDLTSVIRLEGDIGTDEVHEVEVYICLDCLKKEHRRKWEQTKQNAIKFNAWSMAHLDRFVEKED